MHLQQKNKMYQVGKLSLHGSYLVRFYQLIQVVVETFHWEVLTRNFIGYFICFPAHNRNGSNFSDDLNTSLVSFFTLSNINESMKRDFLPTCNKKSNT